MSLLSFNRVYRSDTYLQIISSQRAQFLSPERYFPRTMSHRLKCGTASGDQSELRTVIVETRSKAALLFITCKLELHRIRG